MKTREIGTMVLFLGATVLAACSERGDAHPTARAEAPPAAAPLATTAPATTAPAAPMPATVPTAPPPAVPAPAPRPGSTGDEGAFAVKRLVIARGVKDREPVEPGTSFKADAHKIYAFVEVENRGRGAGEVFVEFQPPGGRSPRGDVTLAVGAAPRWRTWAYTRNVDLPGTWTAVVKNRKGEVLARATFEVTS